MEGVKHAFCSYCLFSIPVIMSLLGCQALVPDLFPFDAQANAKKYKQRTWREQEQGSNSYVYANVYK